MIGLDLAASLAQRAGMFVRVSATGYRMIFYTGVEAEPGTWLEAGGTMINRDGPYPTVSRHAVELICK